MQMLFAVCTASKYSITYRNHGLRFFSSFHSHCHRRASVSAPPDVPVHHPALLGRQPDILRGVRTLHGRRAVQLLAGGFDRVHLGADRPLAADGRHGHGPLRGLYCVRATSQPEGVHPAADRTAHLRRVLGVLLVVHLQHQRDGQGGDPAGGQPRRNRRAQAEPGWNRAGTAQVESTRKAGISQSAQQWPLFHARAGGHRDAGTAAVLRAALRRV